MKNRILLLISGIALMSVTHAVNAGTLKTTLLADNRYWTYLATDDATAGVFQQHRSEFGFPNTASEDLMFLSDGVDYFLHIEAQDAGGIGALIGDLEIFGGTHVFENGLSTIASNHLWRGSNLGFTGSYGAPNILDGNVYSSIWGKTLNVSDDAHYIWVGNPHLQTNAYFSVKITAVPVPSSLAVLLIGVAALAARRRQP